MIASTPTPEGPPAHNVAQQARWLLAGLAAVTAGVHLAFAPDHMAEDWRHGWFFLVLGWAQLAWAVLLVARPRRWVLSVGALANATVIGVWILSRTVGMPDALGGGGVEPVAAADLICSILEAAMVMGSLALLSQPALAERPTRVPRLARGLTMGVIALALVGASVSLTPRFTAAHDHAGHDHSALTIGGDASSATAAHDHTGASASAAGTSGAHVHAATGPYQGDSPCEKAVGNRSSEGNVDAANSTEGHNHHGALPQKPIDAATHLRLVAQQALARSVIDKYPTVADATAAGYKLSTVYLPCIGAHYTKTSLVAQFNPATPSELLYAGTAPDAKILGLSYLLIHPGGAPDGFAGPNDVWHQHSSNGGLCLNPSGLVIGGERTSKAKCESMGGHKNGLKDIWMVHDWVAPAWECSWGVFAAECPELGGRAGGTPWDSPAAD